IIFFYQIVSKVELTNIKCTSLDTDFTDIDYCFLKSVNRSYKYLSLKVKLFKTPVTKVKVNFEILKRYNGYRPWLYNVTVDACRFLRNPKSNLFIEYIHGFFKNYSNMNHTCPFDHDIIVEKVPISFMNERLTQVLPIPTGDYLFQSNWIAYDINRAKVNLYLTLS
ncbi:hypothetical protein KR059_003417, partial [Drosophila kikkawai]